MNSQPIIVTESGRWEVPAWFDVSTACEVSLIRRCAYRKRPKVSGGDRDCQADGMTAAVGDNANCMAVQGYPAFVPSRVRAT